MSVVLSHLKIKFIPILTYYHFLQSMLFLYCLPSCPSLKSWNKSFFPLTFTFLCYSQPVFKSSNLRSYRWSFNLKNLPPPPPMSHFKKFIPMTSFSFTCWCCWYLWYALLIFTFYSLCEHCSLGLYNLKTMWSLWGGCCVLHWRHYLLTFSETELEWLFR